MIVFRPARVLLPAMLVGALLAGLVGMHHVAVADRPGSAVSTTHATPPEHPRDHRDDGHAALLHLCLAVLVAVAVTVMAVLSWWRRVPASRPPLTDGGPVATRPRAPPRDAPARLALLCLLRT